MTSYRPKINPKREQFLCVFSDAVELLQAAFEEAHEKTGLTISELAERMAINKSRVSRVLNGHSNMTLETFSEMAFELGRNVLIALPKHNEIYDRENYMQTFYVSCPQTKTLPNADTSSEISVLTVPTTLSISQETSSNHVN